MTEETFLKALSRTGAFEFDWAWGSEGQYDGASGQEDWDEDDLAYSTAVMDAQKVAAAAMNEARRCYREGDLDGTLSALLDAASAEREFGDDPTYRPMIDYLRLLTEG